jgi:aspartyl-tRNA(Asn)/glutamyl-tRNA(Gln) amidotransferase subunit C
MKITQKDVEYVAALANLRLSTAERERMEKDLNSILDYVDILSEVDTSQVEPMAQAQSVSENGNPLDWLREDRRQPSLEHDVALKNAPQTDGSFFRVPKVIER